jgi:pyridoxine 4-dehydrogenase
LASERRLPVVRSAVAKLGRLDELDGVAIRVAWLLALGPHVLLIPGTSSPVHLEENLRATELRLTDEDRAQLD